MSRLHSHISSAVKVIENYNGTQPFSDHLKGFFSREKKYGSKDRKSIAALSYAYFRTGQAMQTQPAAKKILAGIFLSENIPNEFLQHIEPDWNDKVSFSLPEKLSLLGINESAIFPFFNELPEEIDPVLFAQSFFKQPRLFLRARPGKHATVLQKLNDAGVSFETIGADCISLPNASKIDTILKINNEVLIQDMNSQKVLDFLAVSPLHQKDKKPDGWDCCAASGGKSILLYDRLRGNVRLTVSDIREGILVNLKKRLADAGISINNSFVADLSKPGKGGYEKFDIILCDAPCTGSGTWSRTPEQLYHFNRKKVNEYASLQKNIISNTIPSLLDGGLFFYITCSVFKKENEAQVKFMQEESGLQLLKMEYLKGYEDNADTMFVAVLSRQ